MNEEIIPHFTREVSSPKRKILRKISPDPLLVRRPTERDCRVHGGPHFPAHGGQSLAHLLTLPDPFWLIFLRKEAAEIRG